MDKKRLEQAAEEASDLRFSGTDDRATVTITVNGAGKVVDIGIETENLRRLPTHVFASGIGQALTRARDAAAAADRSATAFLRDQGVDLEAVRKVIR